MTLAQARAHFGFAEDVSEEIVRTAAAGAKIEIADEEAPEDLGTLAEIARSLREAITTAGEQATETQTDALTRIQDQMTVLSTSRTPAPRP